MSTEHAPPPQMPRRYESLHRALSAPSPPVIVLSFVDIHRLGSNLPHRARVDETWWSNGPAGDPQRLAWLTAGRRVQQVDVERSRVWFAASNTLAEADRSVGDAESPPPTNDDYNL